VEEPEPPVILAGLRLHWILLLVEFVETESDTTLVKPLRGVTVIVEGPATPAFTVTLVGLAEIEKSPTACTKEPIGDMLIAKKISGMTKNRSRLFKTEPSEEGRTAGFNINLF
jgi:hypothetical protein